MHEANMTVSKNQPGAMPDCDPNGRLSQLIRGDILRPAGAARPRALFTDQRPRSTAGASAVEASWRSGERDGEF
jgi:hypothetical protein